MEIPTLGPTRVAGIIPHNLGATEQYIKLMLDMVVMAFTTGVSRVGTWGQGLT